MNQVFTGMMGRGAVAPAADNGAILYTYAIAPAQVVGPGYDLVAPLIGAGGFNLPLAAPFLQVLNGVGANVLTGFAAPRLLAVALEVQVVLSPVASGSDLTGQAEALAALVRRNLNMLATEDPGTGYGAPLPLAAVGSGGVALVAPVSFALAAAELDLVIQAFGALTWPASEAVTMSGVIGVLARFGA